MTHSHSVLGAALCGVAILSAPSFAVEMQPGLWELTTKIERAGSVVKRPVRMRCETAEAANAASTQTDLDISRMVKEKLSGASGQDLCKLTDAKNSREMAAWRLQCAGKPDLEQVVTIRFDNPGHYVLVITTSVTALNRTFTTSVLTTEGRHKGECRR